MIFQISPKLLLLLLIVSDSMFLCEGVSLSLCMPVNIVPYFYVNQYCCQCHQRQLTYLLKKQKQCLEGGCIFNHYSLAVINSETLTFTFIRITIVSLTQLNNRFDSGSVNRATATFNDTESRQLWHC